jgi:phage/plasmid-associated DNA primase
MSETTTLTVTTAGPDVAVQKTEVFDLDFADWIVKNRDAPVTKTDRDAVRRIIKESVNGNKHETTYKLGRDIKQNENAGRLCAKGGVGLQSLKRDVRSALAQKFYWDIDIRNAQPTLLEQYAFKRGWVCKHLTRYNENRDDYIAEVMEALSVERWEAKERITALCFGGSPQGLPPFFVNDLYPEFRSLTDNICRERHKEFQALTNSKKPEPARSLMALVLQTEERKCLLELDASLARQGRSLDVYIHDGGLVRKKENEGRFPEELLRKAEKDIFAKHQYHVSLAIKELKTTLVREEDDTEYVPSDTIIDDAFSAKTFADLMEGKIVLDDGVVWVFDDSTGIWTSSETVLNRKMAVEFRDELVFRQQRDGKILLYNYSGDVAHQDRLRRALPSVLPDRTGYFKDRVESSVDKLLFSNGIYDFKTHTFTEGFDPDIVFFGGVPRPFPTVRDETAMAFVRKVFFRDPFVNPAVGDALLHWVARAIAGHYEAKKVIIPYGPANSTKGTLCKHLDTTFGATLLGSFNGDSLLMRTGDVEATKSLSWVKKICDKRIAYSNEITVDPTKKKPINGNLMKTLSGGGDEITLRTNHRDEVGVVNKSIMFIFVNDLPDVYPVDGSVRDRLITIPYTYSFVDEPSLPLEKKRDNTISKTLKTDTYRDATIWLLLDAMKAWNGQPYPLPDECNALKNDLAPMTDLREILGEDYDLTNNADDWVSTEELVTYLRNHKVDGSDRKLGDRLTQIGLGSSVKREGRKTLRVRVGIRRAE